MKKLVELWNVDSDLVAIQTLDTEEIFELVVSKEERDLYQSLLEEAKSEVLEDEMTGVLVVFNQDEKALILPSDESGLF